MTRQVDLNRLRETLTRNQSSSEEPNNNIRDDEKVYVDPDGRLRSGSSTDKSDRTLSEVPQTVFA